MCSVPSCIIFFFNDPPPTEIYTLSLHDALPIWCQAEGPATFRGPGLQGEGVSSGARSCPTPEASGAPGSRSEEHTSELQSRPHLVCRLLLEKKKKTHTTHDHRH